MSKSNRSISEIARQRRIRDRRIQDAATRRGVAPDFIRKQFIFGVFFQRLFSHGETPWMLLGGNALLIRTGGGRFTQDIDLSRESVWDTPESVMKELEELLAAGDRPDDFGFKLTKIKPYSEPDQYGYGAKTAKISVTANFGGREFATFSIDITSRRHVDSPDERIQLQPVFSDEALSNLPKIPTVPAENHLADKICAMYEKHGPNQTPSTRYRDLADVVRLLRDVPFEAARLRLVLDHEAHRRKLSLPTMLVSPAESWAIEYPTAARNFAEYPAGLVPLDAALSYAGACLNPLLRGALSSGRWNPVTQTWDLPTA